MNNPPEWAIDIVVIFTCPACGHSTVVIPNSSSVVKCQACGCTCTSPDVEQLKQVEADPNDAGDELEEKS